MRRELACDVSTFSALGKGLPECALHRMKDQPWDVQQIRSLGLIVGLLLLCLPAAIISKASPPVVFRSFNSVNYLPPAGLAKELGIGWVREGFYWENIEPQ